MVIRRTQTPKHRRTRKSHSGRVLKIKSGSPHEIQAMNSMIQAGPLTIVLIFRPTCPHCVTYKPIWEELTKVKGRTAHMISVDSENWEKTPLASKKQVTGVPTVLYVNSKGEITEAPKPRDTSVMTEVVRTSNPRATSSSEPPHEMPNQPLIIQMPSQPRQNQPLNQPLKNQMPSQPMRNQNQNKVLSPLNALQPQPQPQQQQQPSSPDLIRASQVPPEPLFANKPQAEPAMLPPAAPIRPQTISSNAFKLASAKPVIEQPATELPNAVIPGTMVRPSELSVRPGTTIPSVLTGGSASQRGGDPWSALLFAAQQAAPAAALLGAYAALPVRRSSGLGPARKTRKVRSLD